MIDFPPAQAKPRSQVPFNGAPVGILMLERGTGDRKFVPGDTGNASTWSVPVRYKAVPGLGARQILDPGAGELTSAVVQAATQLVREGSQLITSGCGYMIQYQEAVRAAVNVPVFLSSLLLAPFLETMLPPDKALGILVASKSSLTQDMLEAAGVRAGIGRRVVVAGLEDTPAFAHTFIKPPALDLDVAAVEADVVGAAVALLKERPDIGILLLECGNLPPYAAAVQQATGGIPVFDFTSMIEFFVRGLVRKPFTGLI
ncbi:hypothetical protein [Bradyrhizobium sp. 188]|uniref:hypothetical protein n=1 Tax=Bradyrhizobium sp. 188 TaxID=2782656 RepID=UPI001FF9B17B|nr:hypothetical protein [Bradyrhizobium sp. 188]MCK1496701.1 hypothetical protein [Bradyrhizobium sp. 188]